MPRFCTTSPAGPSRSSSARSGGPRRQKEKIRTYIRTLADSIDRHPQMPRIMMREIASGGQNLPELFFQDLLLILSTLTEIIEEGTRDGVFIETMPVLIHLMTLGTIIIYKTSVPIILQQCALSNTLMNLNRDVVGSISSEVERLILRALRCQ